MLPSEEEVKQRFKVILCLYVYVFDNRGIVADV